MISRKCKKENLTRNYVGNGVNGGERMISRILALEAEAGR